MIGRQFWAASLLSAIAAAFGGQAFGLQEVPAPPEIAGDPGLEAYRDLIPAERDGILPWRLIGNVDFALGEGEAVATFDPGVEKFDGEPVALEGYIVPLESAPEHRHFLLTALPPSCPYCLPAGPGYFVEVFADEPFAFGFEPVAASGELEINRDDWQETGILYRLHKARPGD